MVREGKEFINAEPEEVKEHLETVERCRLDANPSNLKLSVEGRVLILQVMNGRVKEFPVRRSFLHKLLKWYNFPLNQLHRLSPETIASVCNDYLMNIQREYVTIKIEAGDALTLLSPDYNELTDLSVIRTCETYGIDKISRNDFFMSINTEEKKKTQPIPGDECGIGLDIVNSETGFRALGVYHFILRYICTNGAYLKISEDATRVHYGSYDLKKFISQKITKASEQRDTITEKLKKLNRGIEDLPPALIRKVDRALGKGAARGILYNNSAPPTQYELFNYLTSSAKQYGLSKRHHLESLAGEMLMN